MRFFFIKIYLILLCFLCINVAFCQESGFENPSVKNNSTDTITKEHKNIIQKVIGYFNESNKEHREKPFDISFIAGPSYSSEKKFLIGVLAAGAYSTNRSDSLTPLSNVSLYLTASTSGYYAIGIRGTSRFKRDRLRLVYELDFSSMPDKFWGIGYMTNSNNLNETRYKLLAPELIAKLQYGLLPHLYLGPLLEISYLDGKPKDDAMLWLWDNEKLKTFNFAVGAHISYDTRDNLTGPQTGVNIELTQRFYPKWLFNTYGFASTEFSVAGYVPVWRDGLIALRYHTLLTYGNTPWSMLATVGGSYSMRGYYKGRYRDKGEMDATIELRQRVWHRIGAVVWGGAGLIYPRFSEINLHQILPNYGVGLRWEFKKNVNVRLDLGFGKGETGFLFNINEAF